MKKYIIPATDVVALQMQNTLMNLSDHDEVTDPIQYPQLVNKGGWRSENWADYDSEEE